MFDTTLVGVAGLEMRNIANTSRFVVLKHVVIKLQSASATGLDTNEAQDQQYAKFYKKCNIPIEFSSTTGALTEIKSNNLFLLAGCQGGTDNSNGAIQMTGVVRIRFTDV